MILPQTEGSPAGVLEKADRVRRQQWVTVEQQVRVGKSMYSEISRPAGSASITASIAASGACGAQPTLCKCESRSEKEKRKDQPTQLATHLTGCKVGCTALCKLYNELYRNLHNERNPKCSVGNPGKISNRFGHGTSSPSKEGTLAAQLAPQSALHASAAG
jgi:hypothetical protein